MTPSKTTSHVLIGAVVIIGVVGAGIVYIQRRDAQEAAANPLGPPSVPEITVPTTTPSTFPSLNDLIGQTDSLSDTQVAIQNAIDAEINAQQAAASTDDATASSTTPSNASTAPMGSSSASNSGFGGTASFATPDPGGGPEHGTAIQVPAGSLTTGSGS